MSSIDPKVFFSNERTFLKWLHTSVTVGTIGSALLGLNGYSEGFSPMRFVGLLLILVAIVFCTQSLVTYHRRNRLLQAKSGIGYDTNVAPFFLAGTVVVALSSMYIMYLVNRQAVHI